MNFPFRGVRLGGSDQKRSYDIKVSLAKVRNLAKKQKSISSKIGAILQKINFQVGNP